MKKGYKAEWEAKKVLFAKYSPDLVFKVAIGGAVDFLILGNNRKIEKIIEVKKTNKKRWYPTNREIEQYQKLKEIQKKLKIPVEYWIKINGRWEIFNLEKVQKTFFYNES